MDGLAGGPALKMRVNSPVPPEGEADGKGESEGAPPRGERAGSEGLFPADPALKICVKSPEAPDDEDAKGEPEGAFPGGGTAGPAGPFPADPAAKICVNSPGAWPPGSVAGAGNGLPDFEPPAGGPGSALFAGL